MTEVPCCYWIGPRTVMTPAEERVIKRVVGIVPGSGVCSISDPRYGLCHHSGTGEYCPNAKKTDLCDISWINPLARPTSHQR